MRLNLKKQNNEFLKIVHFKRHSYYETKLILEPWGLLSPSFLKTGTFSQRDIFLEWWNKFSLTNVVGPSSRIKNVENPRLKKKFQFLTLKTL